MTHEYDATVFGAERRCLIQDAISQLKEIVVPGTRLTSSNYHGPDWPIEKKYCNTSSEQW
jgi:hypothetical protein